MKTARIVVLLLSGCLLCVPARVSSQTLASATSIQRSIVATVTESAGGTIGFFAGAYAGAGIEYALQPDHRNDDVAGLRGVVIGGTTGAIAGAILGGKFF